MNFSAVTKAILDEPGGRLGGPPDLFEPIGRDSFIAALRYGLLPDHKVLDFGAGCLRLGYWFVHFLEAGHYFAIEPNAPMLEAGKKHLFGPDILKTKSPHFYVSDKCDMATFGVAFDFVIARSIMTHASPAVIHKMFEEFARCAAPGGVMLATYFAAAGDNAVKKRSKHFGNDMPRERWSWHKIIPYTIGHLQSAGSEYGLSVEEVLLDSPWMNEQTWLRIGRSREMTDNDQNRSRSRVSRRRQKLRDRRRTGRPNGASQADAA